MKPIKTAPRDGTQFLSMDARTGRFVVLNHPPHCAMGVWTREKGEWHGSFHPMADKVTHWTKLPTEEESA